MVIINKYLMSVMLYGMARSAVILHDRKLNVYNQKTKQYEDRSLMFTERLSGIVFGTFLTASIAPLSLMHDVHSLELYVRGRYNLEKKPVKSGSTMGIIIESHIN